MEYAGGANTHVSSIRDGSFVLNSTLEKIAPGFKSLTALFVGLRELATPCAGLLASSIDPARPLPICRHGPLGCCGTSWGAGLGLQGEAEGLARRS